MSLIQKAKAKLWRRGFLSWKLHAGQHVIEEAFRRITGKLFVGDCSRQLGKSTWAATKCLETAIRKKKARVRYATAFLTDLEQFILPVFEMLLEDCPEELRPKWNGQKYEYRFPNGSVIRLIGLDRKPNGLRGNKIDLFVLDEAGFISRLSYLYSSVIIPATTHVPDARIIMISTQPESPDHDFCHFCDRAVLENCYVKLDVYQNPLLTEAQIEELARECGGKTTTAFRREYLCERVVEADRAIIPEWGPNYVRAHTPDNLTGFWHRYAAMDIGIRRDHTSVLFAHYNFRDARVYIEDEIEITGPQTTTRQIKEAVTKKEKDLAGYENVYYRVADNSHPLLINDLGSDELFFTATTKGHLDEMVNQLRLWVRAGRVYVHPRCKQLIGCLRSGIWNEKRDKFSHSPVFGHFDALAALIYLVRNIDVHTNPVPFDYGFDRMNQNRFFKKPEISESAQTLKSVFGGAR